MCDRERSGERDVLQGELLTRSLKSNERLRKLNFARSPGPFVSHQYRPNECVGCVFVLIQFNVSLHGKQCSKLTMSAQLDWDLIACTTTDSTVLDIL